MDRLIDELMDEWVNRQTVQISYHCSLMWYSLQVMMILIHQVIMSVCSKYVSYYILIVYLQYIVVLSLLSCLHEENEPEMDNQMNR